MFQKEISHKLPKCQSINVNIYLLLKLHIFSNFYHNLMKIVVVMGKSSLSHESNFFPIIHDIAYNVITIIITKIVSIYDPPK